MLRFISQVELIGGVVFLRYRMSSIQTMLDGLLTNVNPLLNTNYSLKIVS